MRQYLGIAAVCMLFFALGFLSLNQMFIYTPDSARYLIWANSLSRFEGFKDATTPEPTRYVVHAPLYPVLLSAGEFFFPDNVVVAKFITLLTGVFAIFLLYLWLARRTGKGYALLGALMLALNPLMLIFSTQILSDIPFAMCIILFFILLDRFSEDKPGWKTEFWFVTVVIAAFYFREVGLSLVFASAVYFLIIRQYRRCAWLLLISALFYALWYIRNEVIIAEMENTLFRNSRLYFSHIYSTSQESMLREFGGRFMNNVGIYAGYFGKMLFMPEFALNSYMMILPSDPIVSLVLGALPFLKPVLVAVTFIFTAFGIWKEFKASRTILPVSIFLFFYFALILFYPVNDFRFLFPPMVVMIYFFIIGIMHFGKWLTAAGGRYGLHYAGAVLFFLLLVPNIGWVQNFVANSWHYAQSSGEDFKEDAKRPDYPEMFLKPLHLAARWIDRNSGPNAVVYTYWKELAVWLDGRKVVVGSALAASPSIASQLRDYNIGFLVSVDWRGALNECEPQMSQLREFSFIPVYKVGNVQVFRVELPADVSCEEKRTKPLAADSAGIQGDNELFKWALRRLDDDPPRAEPAFRELVARFRKSAVMEYYLGIAKEFIGQTDSAEIIFDKFGAMAQGSIFSRKAWQHKEVISWLKKGSILTDPQERALAYQIDAVNYWGMGYRAEAMKMLGRALEADPDYLPAVSTSAKYLLQQGLIDSARIFALKACSIDSSNSFARKSVLLIRMYDSLKITTDEPGRRELRLKIAELYNRIGLGDNAIDELRKMLCSDPYDRAALRSLGGMMEANSRYAPALRYYARLQKLEPEDAELQIKINSIRRKF